MGSIYFPPQAPGSDDYEVKAVANNGDLLEDKDYLIDASGGSFSLDMPASPSVGNTVRIIWEVPDNNVTLNGNGNNFAGGAGTFIGRKGHLRRVFEFIYNGVVWEPNVINAAELVDIGVYETTFRDFNNSDHEFLTGNVVWASLGANITNVPFSPDVAKNYNIFGECNRSDAGAVNQIYTFTDQGGVPTDNNLRWIRSGQTFVVARDFVGFSRLDDSQLITTVERDAIVAPYNSQLIYNVDKRAYEYYDMSVPIWRDLAGTFNGRLVLNSPITPPTLTVNTDDYSPTGVESSNIIRISSSSTVDLTGLQAPLPIEGQMIVFKNVGGNNIILKSQDAGSIAGNRFNINGNKTLQGGEAFTLVYDVTSMRWFISGISN